jgi:membrane-associated phospholipid phosphatase
VCALVVAYLVAFRIVVGGVAYSAHDKRLQAQITAQKALDFYSAIPALTFSVAYCHHSPGIVSMQYFALSTLWTQSIVLVIKRLACRQRPCLRNFSPPLPERTVPLAIFVKHSKYARESFPSGDAAQAMVFVASMWRVGFSPLWLGLVVLSGAGRVFFHAHHVLDVLAGISIAIFGSLCVHSWAAREVAWYVMAAAVVAFVVFEKVVRRLTSRLHTDLPPISLKI